VQLIEIHQLKQKFEPFLEAALASEYSHAAEKLQRLQVILALLVPEPECLLADIRKYLLEIFGRYREPFADCLKGTVKLFHL
jgi:hypothetical protein